MINPFNHLCAYANEVTGAFGLVAKETNLVISGLEFSGPPPLSLQVGERSWRLT